MIEFFAFPFFQRALAAGFIGQHNATLIVSLEAIYLALQFLAIQSSQKTCDCMAAISPDAVMQAVADLDVLHA